MVSKPVYVLGITDGHNSGACLLKNGNIISMISEERISRIKNDIGYPKKAINKILEANNIRIDEIDLFALAGQYGHNKEFYSNFDWYRVGYKEQLESNKNNINNEKKAKKTLQERKSQIIKHLKISEKKLVVIEHHLAHAATAYFGAPWNKDEKVGVITCDGSGDGICATVSIGHEGKIKRVSETNSSASIGKIYSRITFLMGMKPWEHEYKIMGLAPYAGEKGVKKSLTILNNLVTVKNDSLKFSKKSKISASFCYEYLKKEFENHRFDSIAGATQKFTEELLVRWIKNIVKKTKLKKLAFSGGVFMNVKANMLIRELNGVEDVFVFPSCGDESLAAGAAYIAYAEYLQDKNQSVRINPIDSIYYGTAFSEEDIEESIKKYKNKKYEIEYDGNINNHVAELLEEEKVVARFNGNMEFGARSLGNRSILANPSSNSAIKEINFAIKQRDFWMPFAPSILYEKQEKIIENPKKNFSPYMMQAFKTKKEYQDKFSASMHPYDKTVRPQMVTKLYNLEYHDLISKFSRRTSIPGVLNTSFNLHGFPIVYTPTDAMKTFNNSGLQYLAIGNYLVTKSN